MTDVPDDRPADPFDVPRDDPDRQSLIRMTVFATLAESELAWKNGHTGFLQVCDGLAAWIHSGATQPPGKPPTTLKVVPGAGNMV